MSGPGVQTIPFRGWPNALQLSNGKAELIITLDVGPRILSYALHGGTNVFNIYEDQAGGVGETQWRNRGGHRLWLAPEGTELTMNPDNSPVAWDRTGEYSVRLTPPPEAVSGFQKQMDISLSPTSAAVTVVHRVKRLAQSPCRAAPWALSVMAAGGIAILPQPPLGEHPRDLLPNRRIVIWPYTELADPRYGFGRRFLTLRQDPAGRPTKIGMPSKLGWAAYLLKQTLFVKRFTWLDNVDYPDDGCNLEVFTNARMLELETLGPLQRFQPGDQAEWTEQWELRNQLPSFPAGGLAEQDEFLSACLKNIISHS